MKLGDFEIGLDKPFFLIAGTCVVESEQMTIDTAGKLKEICAKLKIPFIYKTSYDKANRSSGKSFRGLGMDEGLRILSEVKRQLGLPVLTDVHSEHEIEQVAQIIGRSPLRQAEGQKPAHVHRRARRFQLQERGVDRAQVSQCHGSPRGKKPNVSNQFG